MTRTSDGTGQGTSAPRVCIIAPYWNNTRHVGVYRVERMIRWLRESGYGVVLVTSGAGNRDVLREWGTEVSVGGRIRRDQDDNRSSAERPSSRTLRRWWWRFAQRTFIPDQGVLWGWRALRNERVNAQVKLCAAIVSSSPPESVHLLGRALGTRHRRPYIVDLRDGWMDEPLNPFVRSGGWRAAVERRLESRVFNDAAGIIVTSEEWARMLLRRRPESAPRTVVVTNGYPRWEFEPRPGPKSGTDPLSLLYAGNFSVGMAVRPIDPFLGTAVRLAKRGNDIGVEASLRIIGDLTVRERQQALEIDRSLRPYHWGLKCLERTSRSRMFDLFAETDGFIVLSTTMGSIPSKIFEYIPTRKPFLVIARRESAAWQACHDVPQAFLCDLGTQGGDGEDAMQGFLHACRNGAKDTAVPVEFSEPYLKERFIGHLRAVMERP